MNQKLNQFFRSYEEFLPRTVSCFSQYSLKVFTQDLIAGITVGIVALPLAMAFAIASGVPPERGLYTAIVAGFLISALGGSRVQIGGPTGAFVVVIYNIVMRHGYEGLEIATILAGVFLLLMGFFRLGSLIKFIPYPVTTGFTTGIAIIIFSSQVRDFFGLQMEKVPADFLAKWGAYVTHFGSWNPSAFFLSGLCLCLLVLQRKFWPRLPGPLLVILLAAFLVNIFGLEVETIGSRFGSIPRTLPAPQFPPFELWRARELLPEAFTIALLAAIESLLSAVVADGLSGDRHKSNTELLAQGVANIVSIFFGGIPATGAIARTATNVKSGAQTPMAGMMHSIVLLLGMLVFAPYARLIPLCSLAAILTLVAWNMAEVDHFRSLLRAPRSDVAVLLTTLLLTVLVDLTVAVEVGIVMAALLFMKRMSEITDSLVDTPVVSSSAAEEQAELLEPDVIDERDLPKAVEIYEINGPLFFGIADRLKDTLEIFEAPPKVFILRMRHVPVIDATGLHALEEFHRKCARQKTVLILSGVWEQVAQSMKRTNLWKAIGSENIVAHIDEALTRAKLLVEGTTEAHVKKTE